MCSWLMLKPELPFTFSFFSFIVAHTLLIAGTVCGKIKFCKNGNLVQWLVYSTKTLQIRSEFEENDYQ